jgi:1D-myo-inositol 3-kinase
VPPDFLAIGHVVRDVTEDGWRPGGSVLYAAAQAGALGLEVAAATACGPDVDPPAILPGVRWHVRRDSRTTSFENLYTAVGRRQRLLDLAEPLSLDDVPVQWRESTLILIGPVFQDVDPALPSQLAGPGRLVAVCPQGWLRRREGDRLLPGPAGADPEWLAGDVLVVSREDTGDEEVVAGWQTRVPLVVLTRGSAGCSVWDASGRRDYAVARVEEETDPTGAGDVFAAALLIALWEGKETQKAISFASAAAGLSVREAGMTAIAGREAIEARAQAAPEARAGR